MGVKKYKPTSPGRRFRTVSDFSEITRSTPEKSLLEKKTSTGGRNSYGRKTSRHRGGGHKRRYRVIGFRRNKDGVPATVAAIEYDPNRNARIALLHYVDGEKRYILAPVGVEVGDMLESGDDIRFGSYKPGQPGYPSLRMALLDAAASTGDPEAVALIAQVARETESPVEVVFSAHVLDKLDALDSETAQRTLDTALTKLSPADAKAVRSILGKVIPAAAAAEPAYTETILQQQIRNPERNGGQLRAITPMLDGLPIERAQDVIAISLTSADVTDRAKYQLASRAARRPEIEMLEQLRTAIESNTLEPRLARTIAQSSVSGRPYGMAFKNARRSLKANDVRGAQEQAKQFQARLAEANKTIAAARAAGAKVPPKVSKQASIHRENLQNLLRQISRKNQQLQKQAAAAQK